MATAMTPQEVLAMCRERDIKAVDLRFMDFPGIWQHFTIPVSKLEEEIFEEEELQQKEEIALLLGSFSLSATTGQPVGRVLI